MTTFAIMLTLSATAAITALAARVLMPLLRRYALARPNARSSHDVPTPQGGGIAVLAGLVGMALAFMAIGLMPRSREVVTLLAAALALGLLGGWDDIRPLPALLRLIVQGAAVAGVISTLPALTLVQWPVAGTAPPWLAGLNLALVVLAGVWFVNLTNFMDGLDWLTVAGFVPLTGFLALLGITGLIAPTPALIAALLCGALLGFAPLNRPVARLFLGDVGSLPIGLVVAWLLHALAGDAGLAAAVLLPLYHITDATWTLVQRLCRGEPVWQAHRSHAYQRATSHGFSVMAVAAHVLGLNLVLCGLALACVLSNSAAMHAVCLGAGFGLTVLLIRRFSQPRDAVDVMR